MIVFSAILIFSTIVCLCFFKKKDIDNFIRDLENKEIKELKSSFIKDIDYLNAIIKDLEDKIHILENNKKNLLEKFEKSYDEHQRRIYELNIKKKRTILLLEKIRENKIYEIFVNKIFIEIENELKKDIEVKKFFNNISVNQDIKNKFLS